MPIDRSPPKPAASPPQAAIGAAALSISHAYVISLSRRPDRRERSLRWNSGKQIELSVFDAVDGRTLRRADLVNDGIIVSESLGFSSGALGNALSHRRLWETCIDLGRPIMILEDDAQLPDDIAAWLEPIAREVENSCDIFYVGYNRDAIVSIGYGGQWCNLAFEAPPRERRSADTMSAPPSHVILDTRLAWGTLGYVVSPRGAAALLRCCFPLSDRIPVRMYGSGRLFTPDALDGVINAMVQRGAIRARLIFPPLVVGPNDKSDSDVIIAAPSQR
jgi:glycosyl transferase, family 25